MFRFMIASFVEVLKIWFIIVQAIEATNEGVVKKVSLILHGTKEMPHHVKDAGGRRTYNLNYNNVHNTREVGHRDINHFTSFAKAMEAYTGHSEVLLYLIIMAYVTHNYEIQKYFNMTYIGFHIQRLSVLVHG